MSNRRIGWLMLAVVSGSLAGCGTGGQPEVAGGAAPAKPGSPPPLAELLKQPRAELAKRADELVAEIKTREEGRARGTVKFALLPEWNPPRTIPVFRKAKYVPEVGLSLPPYAEAKELDKDPELAVHYARFGDREAAIQLAGRATPPIEQFAGANYPVEWTRLVALQIYSLEQRIATGDHEALSDLLAWHRQMEQVLDDAANKGWLGWSLLPRGRRTVEQAAAAWRAKNQTAPAEQAEAALAKWNLPGEPPSLERSKKYWLDALRTTGEGRAVSASPVERGLDFLGLPLPEEAAEGALFFFNRQNQLEQVIVTYTPRVTQQYARGVELAGELANWTPPESRDDRLCLQRWPGLTVETQLGPAGSVPGGWMRVLWETKPESESVPRALGSVHLDRSFDENRLHLTPNLLGTSITIQQPELLAKVHHPLPKLKLASLTMTRPENEDYLEEARFRWSGALPVDQLALPLFAQLGPGRWSFEPFNSAQGLPAHFQIAWENAVTQTLLRVPYDLRQMVEVVHRDRRDPAQAADRRSAVSALEETERRQRLEAGKPMHRLMRKLEQLPLGTDRATILKYLPQGQAVFKRDLPDGILVANHTAPGKGQTYQVRQILVRFDGKDRLSWVRARYEGVANKTKKDSDWAQQLLNYWRTQGGAVAPIAAPFKERTADLPKPTSATALYRWKDDLTEVTYLLDSGGVEITVQERPSAQAKPAPLVYLPRGPEGVLAGLTLGATRSDLQAKLPTKPTEEGGYLLGVPADRPYDVVLVWFDKDRVQRIAARYRQADPPKTTPVDMEKALYAQWGAELRTVGWPTRRDASKQNPIQAFTWFDDQTRYRLYWAESDKSPPRLWSEWRDDQ